MTRVKYCSNIQPGNINRNKVRWSNILRLHCWLTVVHSVIIRPAREDNLSSMHRLARWANWLFISRTWRLSHIIRDHMRKLLIDFRYWYTTHVLQQPVQESHFWWTLVNICDKTFSILTTTLHMRAPPISYQDNSLESV